MFAMMLSETIDYDVLDQLAKDYTMEGVVTNPSGITDLLKYWS
jgi:hypothetical protein